MSPMNVETVIVCDDIRQEGNGKYILIGVYGGNVIVRGFPTDLLLSVWLLGRVQTPGLLELRIRIRGPKGATLVEGHLEVNVKEVANATIMAIPRLPLQVQAEGKMEIEISPRDKDEWTLIKSLDLVLSPRSSPAS